MCRTTVNVWGDAVGAKIISKLAPDTDEDEELEPELA
jgi:Na+/H+-dicarboxylate symporter